MADYEAREEKLLGKIADRLNTLDETLAKMEDTDSKVKHFFEQEKALHEIRVITRKENRINRDEDKAEEKDEKQMSDWISGKMKLVDDIDKRIDTLDATLAKLDEDKDSKVKSYLEQKKAIEEIKKILKDSDKLEK